MVYDVCKLKYVDTSRLPCVKVEHMVSIVYDSDGEYRRTVIVWRIRLYIPATHVSSRYDGAHLMCERWCTFIVVQNWSYAFIVTNEIPTML